MTYVEIVNKILRRMREPVVASVAESTYSLMVGEFVNDAKRVVEDAWAWRALIDTVTITTIAGTPTYDLEDFNATLSGSPVRENARVFIDPDSSAPLIRMITSTRESQILQVSQSYKFIERQQAENTSSRSKPDSAIFMVNPSPTTGNTNLRVRLFPIPDAVYSVQVFVVNPQNDLTSNTDVLLVPSHPVVQLGYLYTLYERGEELGETLTLTSEKADMALANAIQLDSSNTSEPVFRV